MNLRNLCLATLLSFVIALSVSSCGPSQPVTPTVDVIGTISMELAYTMQTQTAAAASPTPLPATATPPATPTETPAPTKNLEKNTIIVITFAPCYFGPGSGYGLESNISADTKVRLLGQGSVQGWYIVNNPYFHQPCWISAADVRVDSDVDMSRFPVMTPSH